MSNLINKFRKKAKKSKKIIVLPEGNEPRILKAAKIIKEENIADLVLLGKKQEILSIARKENIDIEDIQVINPGELKLSKKFARIFYKLRKSKGITEKDAKKYMEDPLYFGIMMVYTNRAHGMVAGSINPTGDVLRPGFQIIKTKQDISTVSAIMVMNITNKQLETYGTYVFADVAVNPYPDSAQLAEIAISSAKTMENLLDMNPQISMLSFSTKGSADHELVEKVKEATKIVKKKSSDMIIDGELQADAALIPSVAKVTAPNSAVAGKANVLIFPDLQAANIGYKLVQRMSSVEVIGPVLQGLAKPVNDLSRGCSVGDIVNVVAITSVQSQEL